MRKWWNSLVHKDNLCTVRVFFQGMETTAKQDSMLQHKIGDHVRVGMLRSDVGETYFRQGIVVGITLDQNVRYDVAFPLDGGDEILGVVRGLFGEHMETLEYRTVPDVSVLTDPEAEDELQPEDLQLSPVAPASLPITWLDKSFYEGIPLPVSVKPSSIILGKMRGSQYCIYQIGDKVRFDLYDGEEERPDSFWENLPAGYICAIHIGQTFAYDVAIHVEGSSLLPVLRNAESHTLALIERGK